MAKTMRKINNPYLFFDGGQPPRFYTEITLFDLLAGFAMQGMLAYSGKNADYDAKPSIIAEASCAYAKALLKEREKVLQGD